MILIPISSLVTSSDLLHHSFAAHSFDLYQSPRLLFTTPTNTNTTFTHHGPNTRHCSGTLHRVSPNLLLRPTRSDPSSSRGMFGTLYREQVQKKYIHPSLAVLYTKIVLTSRARLLFLKGWLRWLPDHAEVLVGIAVGDPIHVKAL